MEFDPARILKTLARHRVDYVVVGGIAAVLHGSPLNTDDLDIVPALKKTNLEALAAALNELGASVRSQEVPGGIAIEWTATDLHRLIVDFRFLHLATAHGRLDVIHRPAATDGYQDVAAGAEDVELDDVTVAVASLEDVIRSKGAVARARDLEQLPTLRLLLEAKRKRR